MPSSDALETPRHLRRLLTAGLALALGGMLLAPAAAGAAAPAPTTTVVPDTAKAGLAGTAVPSAADRTAADKWTRAATERTLKLGLRGDDVKALQTKLIGWHYVDVTTADGVFGAGTHHAVVAFQKQHSLGRDGIVGPATRAKLAAAQTPKPVSPRRGRYVEVNLTKQVLYFFFDNRSTMIVDISSGSGSTYVQDGVTHVARTPTGQFAITRKINGWRESKLGLLYRPSYFYGGYAIHGSLSVPPYPASHGCVRVTNPTTDRIYGYLTVGTPVKVYR